MGSWAGDDTVTIDSPFCQRNEMWANRPLGTLPGSTFRKYGCLVCASARMLTRVSGLYWSPWELNKKLAQIGGFDQGNLLDWFALERIEPRLEFIEREPYTGPVSIDELRRIGEFANGGGEILIEVDYDRNWTNGRQPHWLHLDAIKDERRNYPYPSWYAYDPWYGEIVEVGQYYSSYYRGLEEALYGVALYEVA